MQMSHLGWGWLNKLAVRATFSAEERHAGAKCKRLAFAVRVGLRDQAV